MSRQTVQLRIPIPEDWDSGDGLQVYTDFGSGELDTDKPLAARAISVFPGQQPARGVRASALGKSRTGDGRAARPHRGVGDQIAGVTPCGTSPTFALVEVEVPAAFGAWKFGARILDRAGNVQAAAINELEAVVSGTEPPALASFGFASYDAETDQVTFDFEYGQD